LIVLEGEAPTRFTTRKALKEAQTASIGVVFDDVSFWDPAGWETLREVLACSPHVGAVGPVSNEATVLEQRVAPPFPYQTPTLFRLACNERRQLYHRQWREVPSLDAFAFLVRRSDFEGLSPDLPLAQVPVCLSDQGRALAITLDTYVHRYGKMYEQPRDDLQALVPREAGRILDVGCAAGAFASALKARQDCYVVGIEANPALATSAAEHLDQVIQGSVEEVAATTFGAYFDCIACGDVLEHLRDPWAVVAKLAAWLRPAGRLIATLPNVGHWSIVFDLLQGRWDLVPFSLLCWSHLRFFTRSGVERLFDGHGLTVELLQGMTEELREPTKTFVERASTLVPHADSESLRTSEFLVVARKLGG
jgi:2-polyprenyl-3-methyl-5-hydroxy-6-metoxy-1,4-benzoquinol methylase